MKNRYLPLLCAVFYFLYRLFFTENLTITSLGLALSVFIFVDFVNKLGQIFPIKEFILLIACLQWIVGAALSYGFEEVHYRYHMYVDESIYMSYVVPGVLLLTLGLYLFKTNLTIDRIRNSVNSNSKTLKIAAKVIITIGLVSTLLSRSFPSGGFAFIFYLLSILVYVGVAYLFFLYPHRKWTYFLGVIAVVFVLSINSGLFHELLLIGSFLGFIMVSKSTKFVTKLTFIIIGFTVIYSIQLVKNDLRAQIWAGKQSKSGTTVFIDLIEEEFFSTPNNKVIVNKMGNADEKQSVDANSRLNQGWIISKILNNVPDKEPFLGGETVTEAISTSILPRFLFPNKKDTNQGLINFQRITGLHLEKGTSMGLSIIGEFYANYGVVGGWFAMFIYGGIIGLIIRWLINGIGNGSPVILFWFILIFFQVVKAETDLIKVVNHLFKSIVLFLVIRGVLLLFNIDIIPRINK